ncbi:MAG: hypothetical protein RR202_08075 [Bacteroidales bacterium]
MIRQDYLLAMIENFFLRISRLKKLNQEKPQEVLPELNDIYQEFLNMNREFFLSSSLKDIYSVFGQKQDSLAKTEMLAELMYQELNLFKSTVYNRELAHRLLELYDFIDHESNELSLERMKRRDEIIKILDSEI